MLMLNVILFMYALIKTKYMFNIYQQSNYQIRPYTKHFIRNVVYNNLFIFLFFMVTLVTSNKVIYFLVYAYFLIYALIMYKDFRKKLVFTNRIKRKIAILVLTLLGICFINNLIVKTVIIIFFEFFSIVILYLINFLENLYSKKFINQASKKLSTFDKKIVGISGSYGKTSVKHFLGNVLSDFENTLYTQKSYNTPLGIAKCLNENSVDIYDNIILEYGASKKNDTKYLLKKYKCNIGILTSLGENHLDSFKSFENIVTEEALVINTLKVNEVGFLNYEDDYIRNLTLTTKAKIITVGIAHGDYQAKNISPDQHVCFDAYYKNKFLGHVKTKLIGKHNIINLLLVIAFLDYFNYDLDIVFKKIKQLNNIENRLSIKKYDDHTIINDAFNSNINGSLNALKLLKDHNGTRFLITSSFAEMKKVSSINNIKYTNQIVKSVDVCILVGFNESKELYRLIDNQIKVYMVDNIDEAFKLFYSLKKEHSYLLIDNDLPDIYVKRSL